MEAEPVSWYSYNEFCHVFSKFDNLDEFKNIVSQIELWNCKGRIPSAIHATSCLLRAVAVDLSRRLVGSDLADLYGMSIIRSVNLILDAKQESYYARSLALMGKEADMPPSVVKCRQRCAHGEMPDLDTLRLTARDFVNFLYKKYWIPQKKSISYKTENDEFDCVGLLSLFCVTRTFILAEERVLRPVYILNVPRKHKNSKGVAIADVDNRLLTLHRKASLTSLGRRKACLRKKSIGITIGRANFGLLDRLSKLATRILEGSLYEYFIISSIIEFGFVYCKPRKNCLYLVYVFQALEFLSFNFAVRLVAHWFSVAYGLPDQLTRARSNSIQQRAKSLSSLHTTRCNIGYIEKWFEYILRAARNNDLDSLFQKSYLSRFGIVGVTRLTSVAKCALQRIYKAATLLYPCACKHLGVCRFEKLDLLLESVHKDPSDICRFLQPGTSWSSSSWSMKIPWEEDNNVTHSRIEKALATILEFQSNHIVKGSNRIQKLKHLLTSPKDPYYCIDQITGLAGAFLYSKYPIGH